jgi:hypothetical protein
MCPLPIACILNRTLQLETAAAVLVNFRAIAVRLLVRALINISLVPSVIL